MKHIKNTNRAKARAWGHQARACKCRQAQHKKSHKRIPSMLKSMYVHRINMCELVVGIKQNKTKQKQGELPTGKPRQKYKLWGVSNYNYKNVYWMCIYTCICTKSGGRRSGWYVYFIIASNDREATANNWHNKTQKKKRPWCPAARLHEFRRQSGRVRICVNFKRLRVFLFKKLLFSLLFRTSTAEAAKQKHRNTEWGWWEGAEQNSKLKYLQVQFVYFRSSPRPTDILGGDMLRKGIEKRITLKKKPDFCTHKKVGFFDIGKPL